VKNEVINFIEEDKENDVIQKMYKSAEFKIKTMKVGDMIGASYPRNDFEYFYYEGKESFSHLSFISHLIYEHNIFVFLIKDLSKKRKKDQFLCSSSDTAKAQRNTSRRRKTLIL